MHARLENLEAQAANRCDAEQQSPLSPAMPQLAFDLASAGPSEAKDHDAARGGDEVFTALERLGTKANHATDPTSLMPDAWDAALRSQLGADPAFPNILRPARFIGTGKCRRDHSEILGALPAPTVLRLLVNYSLDRLQGHRQSRP